MLDRLDHRIAGLALGIAATLVLAVVLATPARTTLPSTPALLIALVVLPVAALGVAVYSVRGGPFAGGAVFVLGSYLALLGVTLLIGFGASPGQASLRQLAGLAILAAAVLAVLAGSRAGIDRALSPV